MLNWSLNETLPCYRSSIHNVIHTINQTRYYCSSAIVQSPPPLPAGKVHAMAHGGPSNHPPIAVSMLVLPRRPNNWWMSLGHSWLHTMTAEVDTFDLHFAPITSNVILFIRECCRWLVWKCSRLVEGGSVTIRFYIVANLRDRKVACSALDHRGSNFEFCVWKAVSSHLSHHP